MVMDIDMDVEKGRQSKGKNVIKIQVRQSKKLNLATLDQYIQGRYQFGNDVIEAISMLIRNYIV